ncbi:unnamed protein product [Mytilus coruscus]|uniref:Kringle domain-containing protein n=1 Tax=Mytilus coruscus TaxID=42192 RepID=A0A6J8A3S0_MYTCO|nr:unnamed protein product [Mytilus coruscus]
MGLSSVNPYTKPQKDKAHLQKSKQRSIIVIDTKTFISHTIQILIINILVFHLAYQVASNTIQHLLFQETTSVETETTTIASQQTKRTILGDTSTTTNFAKAGKIEPTTDKFLSTYKESSSEEKETTAVVSPQKNWTILGELKLGLKNIIYCASKCHRSPNCKAVSYNDLSKACELHGTVHSTIEITNGTGENQYLVIPKDIPTTTNSAEGGKFETTEDKFLSTVQETTSETTTIISQQKNWTILGADDCYLTTSLEYSGTISYTVSGIPCQYWNTNSPHYRYYLPVDTTAHDTNYCRETNNYEGGPVCYTSDPAVNWEYCYIVKCDACGVDERLPMVPFGTTSHFHVGKFIGMVFTCDTLTSGNSVDHCPVSQCGADDQWTANYSVSCTDEDCYTDSTTYQGKVTCTAAGITCDVWTNEAAMQAGPDKNTNYCRDPDGTGAPWCYSTDPNVRWDFCPVPKC